MSMNASPAKNALRILIGGLLLISGCDRITGEADNAKLLAEGKATGSSCRHSGRAIQDCYTLNPEASRAAIFAGWREMSDYMRENNIPDVKPELPSAKETADAKAAEEEAAQAASAAAAAAAAAAAEAESVNRRKRRS